MFSDDYQERDLNPPDDGAPTQEVCRYCERPFYEADSDADDRTRFCSRDCQEDAKADEDDRDPAYERAAARARGNDFEDTNGKDWT